MRLLMRIFALAVLAMVAVLAILGAWAPWSPSGWFTLGVVALGAAALAIKEPRPRRGLGLVAAVLLAILFVVRTVGAGDGMIAMRTLPSGEPARWLARLVDEQDVALAGARLLTMRGRLTADERARLVPAMREAYVELRRDDVVTPSPLLDTLLGRQTATAFDALVIEPRAEPKASVPMTSAEAEVGFAHRSHGAGGLGNPPRVPIKFGVLFLHGYAGSYTLECWLVARAAREIGAVTVCPATDSSGNWRNETGEHILRAALDYLHRRNIKRVFLAGLSNGAIGASALSGHFSSFFEGLVLLSGAPAGGDNGGLPALVVHGTHDTMAPVAAARAFAEHHRATYAELAGGHFVLLTHRTQAREAIVKWLMQQSGYHAT